MLGQLNDLTSIVSQLYSTCRVCCRVEKHVHVKVVFSLSPFFSSLRGCLLHFLELFFSGKGCRHTSVLSEAD